jgi:hypothetical protein
LPAPQGRIVVVVAVAVTLAAMAFAVVRGKSVVMTRAVIRSGRAIVFLKALKCVQLAVA